MNRRLMSLKARYRARQRKSKRLLTERLEERCLLATLEWDAGGDGTSWHDALNWSGDAVPTPLDDVIITRDAAGGPVVFDTGMTQILSLSLDADLEVRGGELVADSAQLGGTLLVAGGDFFANTTLNVSDGARLEVNGSESELRSSGSSDFGDNVEIHISDGGSLEAPRATTLEDAVLNISGPGTVDLTDLTSFDGSRVSVGGGAQFAFPANVTSYTGPTGARINQDFLLFHAVGAGSLIDATSLTTFNSPFGGLGILKQSVAADDGRHHRLFGSRDARWRRPRPQRRWTA